MSRSDPSALAERLVELCDVASVTGEERALADALAERHAGRAVTRVGDSLVVGEPDGRPLVLLVGHLDTVPPTVVDRRARIEPGDDDPVVVGRGASDMKGGVAVAEACLADVGGSSAYGLVLVLYAREEGPAEENELATVLDEVPWLREAGLAVVLEPTDLEVQLGCLGGLHTRLTFHGRAAHSARPWLGENALTKAGALLAELHARAPVERTVDGLVFREVRTATTAWTDNARNVVPETFTLNVNERFAPDRTLDEAEAELVAWVGDRASVEVVDRAPPAPPSRDAPLVAAFVDAVGAPVTAKQAWTDVARFAAVGVPALNFGPGLTAQAHRSGEYVPVANLATAAARLTAFLSTPPPRS